MQRKSILSRAKKRVILLLFVILNFTAYGQNKNNVSLVYGTGSNVFGSPNYITQPFNMVGINYTRKINKWFYLESGLEYYNNTLGYDQILHYMPMGPDHYVGPSNVLLKGSIKTISIPFYANFVFFKYLYADIGLNANFEGYNLPDGVDVKPNFLGFGIGIGGQYTFKNNITVFVNPFFKGDISENAVLNYGFKFGLGYEF